MKLYLAADHAGFELKQELSAWLKEQGHQVEDLGAHDLNPEDDYPRYAKSLAHAVADNPNHKGIMVCGSGQGMAIVANRIPGVRASVIWDEATAKETREDNDSNVISLPARFIDQDRAKKIVQTWLKTDFSGLDKHRRRIQQIDEGP